MPETGTLRAVLRTLFALMLTASSLSFAQECGENFAECKDDCLIEFGGSIRVEMKKKYERCLKRCTKVSRRCDERDEVTRTGNLDEGSLAGTPTTDQVDSNGIPTRSRKEKKTAPVEERSTASRDDDDAPPRPKDDLRESEMPKSNRTQLKVEEKKKEDEPAPAPAKKIEMKLTPQKEDEDLRDDKPRAQSAPAPKEDEPPPPPPKKEKKKDPPPKKEEDHDDLRFY